ncbi:ATP-binding protein [Desertivirga brevis]|uniref:ATP-binding protein n=1 Tax=Desertivirga brevis TaxID=2810310 RepID=UPI001A96C7AF|nr:ATP-binding protein [Pedobacter sp. SYSU D00873]
MIKHTTKLTSRSIEQGGMPSDYKKAIAEYIWNGFDAGATRVNIDFSGNSIGYLSHFSIADNGSGIDIETIDTTFGNFLDSIKADSYLSDSFIKGKKGKGRFAFSIFANKCVWNTTFRTPEAGLLEYSISINKGDQQNFTIEDRKISANSATGTKVQFLHFFDLTSDLLEKKEFVEYLASEFGWFLYLNRDKDYSIFLNGIPLDYSSIISEHESFSHVIDDYAFTISYIRWARLIGDKFYFYFLNSGKKEISRKHTSFNNNTVEFFHSVYIESSYFDNFKETQMDAPVIAFAEKNQADLVFRHLLKFLNTYVSQKEKQFVKDTQAVRLISNYHTTGIFPKFKNDHYDLLRKEDLELVVKELYCAQPKIFQGLKKEQSKTLIGFLNLLLGSEQREHVLDVVEGVVKLTEDERVELAEVLKKTKLNPKGE